MIGLKIQRIKKGVTQERLAQETNLSVRQIRSYEQGSRRPKIETLNVLATYFNCTVDELVNEERKTL